MPNITIPGDTCKHSSYLTRSKLYLMWLRRAKDTHGAARVLMVMMSKCTVENWGRKRGRVAHEL